MVSFEVNKYKVTQGLDFSRGSTTFDTYIECNGDEGESLTILFVKDHAVSGFSDVRAKRGTSHVPAEQFDWYVDLLRNETPVYAIIDGNPKINGLQTGHEDIGQSEYPNLTDWLTAHPDVRDAIKWDNVYSSIAYDEWPDRAKAELNDAFDLAVQLLSIPLTDPPPNQIVQGDDDLVRTLLKRDHAWPLYLANVAHSLAVEIMGWVKWSVVDYPAEQLDVLFDSRSMFHWNHDEQLFEIHFDPHGVAVPPPPAFAYKFLVEGNLIADNHLKSIARLLDWCRWNMSHDSGQYEASNMVDHWQYRGFAPVSRVVGGTVYIKNENAGRKHYTAGCHGTVGFLRSVLRTLNIPVAYRKAHRHAVPHFLSVNKFLSHGDDPYGKLAKSTEPFPAEELLIDNTTFQRWFGPGVPDHETENNVGRRVVELAVEHPPDYLLWLHCKDEKANRSPEDSLVFLKEADNQSGAWLSRHFSMDELNQKRLWERLRQKVKRRGGCGKIHQPTY